MLQRNQNEPEIKKNCWMNGQLIFGQILSIFSKLRNAPTNNGAFLILTSASRAYPYYGSKAKDAPNLKSEFDLGNYVKTRN